MSGLLHDLVDVVRKTENALLTGQCKLSLITPVLVHFTSDLIHLPTLHAPRHDTTGRERRTAEAHLEDLQYLGFVADRLYALKIVHGEGTLQGLSLQPFRSLKYLELKRLPIHMLKGLANLRGQLECIVCYRSLQNLELLLKNCGGDASPAFSWQHLTTLICTDCDIEELDSSLELTPSLRNLDLCRNSLRNCGNAFLSLEELVAVNLNYNQIEKIPRFSATVRHRLRVLTLRNNCLESLEALEDLENLQELDLSDNCIASHRLLWPLQHLSRLTKLSLVGNPIYHHPKHRVLTLRHVNPRTAKHFTLDGARVTRSEAVAVPDEPVRPLQRSASPHEALSVSIGSSVEPPLSLSVNRDDISSSVGSVGRSGRKTVRVRTVKIDAPQHDPETVFLPTEPVLLSSSVSSRLTEDIEQLREKFGEEWLKFQAAQEPSLQLSATESPPEPSFLVFPDREDNFLQPDERLLRTASLERPEVVEQTQSKENESQPFLVQLEDKPDPEDSLLVSLGDVHLIERNISGVIVEMLEINSILKSEVADNPRAIAIFFDYMRKDRRKRKYLFENVEQAQDFLEMIRPLVEEKEEKVLHYKCLQCSEIFPEYRAEMKVKYQARNDFPSGYSSSVGSASLATKGVLAETLCCPFCSSEMLMEHKSDSDSSSETPEQNNSPPNTTPDEVLGKPFKKPKIKRSSSVVILANEPSYSEETILPSSYRSPVPFQREITTPTHSVDSFSAEEAGLERQDSSEETLFTVQGVDEAVALLRAKFNKMTIGGLDWNFEDYQVADHRLRLHIDMNILMQPGEQFCLIVKIELVTPKSADPQEAVMVVSNLSVFAGKMEGDISQDVETWLVPEDSAVLQDLNLVHTVCEGECLRLGFTDGTFWLLLFRDRTRCAQFTRQLEDVLATNKVPFYMRETNDTGALETWLAATPFETDDSTEPSLAITLRALCFSGKSAVTLVCTETHLIMTREDFQQLLRGGSSVVDLVDAKAISAISCLVAYQQSPTTIGIKFFEDDPACANEWDFRFETVNGLDQLVQAIREPWEKLVFHVPLNVELHPP